MITNKSLPIILLFFAALSGCAQVQIISVEKLQLPESGKFYHPKLDDSGNLMLLTSEYYKGIQLYNLKTRELKLITDGDGAGYSPHISDDGETVLFTQNEFIQNRLFSKLMAYQVPAGATDQVAPAARDLSSLFQSGDQVVYRADGQLKTARISSSISGSSGEMAVGIDDRKLMVYTAGQAKRLDPFENESYIWPSVSPDGKRILAYAMGKGAFICDPDGKLITELGNLEAPVWADNGFIAGMITKEDGHQITESEIVMLNIRTGRKLTISPRGAISMYPSVSLPNKKMAFQSAEGDIYILTYDITP
jgi:Tol biopolymer transport system component